MATLRISKRLVSEGGYERVFITAAEKDSAACIIVFYSPIDNERFNYGFTVNIGNLTPTKKRNIGLLLNTVNRVIGEWDTLPAEDA